MTTVAATGLASSTAAAAAADVDAGGTMWRLRSLVAMGHDGRRIANALDVDADAIQAILRGDSTTVSPSLRDLTCQLWDAWWDKRPPERTVSEHERARAARSLAEHACWCPPLGLDEDELDEPGYRPYSRYREASGTGIATDFRPSCASRGSACPARASAGSTMACISVSEAGR